MPGKIQEGPAIAGPCLPAIIISAALLLFSDPGGAEQATGRILTIGKTGSLAPKAEKQLLPIVRYLAKRLSDRGVAGGQVLVRTSKEALAEELRKGGLDLVPSSPHPTVFFRREEGTLPILLGSRNGLLAYHGYIFTRKDGDLSGLPGLAEISSLGERSPPGKVGYIFAHDDLNISSWVFLGKVGAGVMSSALWEEQKSNPDAYRSEFRVPHSSLDVPRLIVSARPGLAEPLRAEIRRLLLLMNGDPEGVEALVPDSVDHFTELPSAALDTVEDMFSHFTSKGSP